MKNNANICQVPSCAKVRAAGCVMCETHWKAVPPNLKAAVTRVKPGAGLPPSKAYAKAVANAIDGLRSMGLVAAAGVKPATAPTKKLPVLTSSGAISKAAAMARWRALPANQPLKPTPIKYGHRGTTIDEDGIRICGSLEFIDSVLSRLKPLLDYENGVTRIGIAYAELSDRETKQRMAGRFRCAVQVHQRG